MRRFVCLCATGLDFPDGHLRSTHEDVVEDLLKKLRAGEYTGKKPANGKWSDMYPVTTDGYLLAMFVMQQPQVLAQLAAADAQNLDG